jgi:hypothetical protein
MQTEPRPFDTRLVTVGDEPLLVAYALATSGELRGFVT